MEENELLELARAGLYGLLALIGGLVAYLSNTVGTETFAIKMLLIKGISSGFAGFLIGLLCIYFQVPSTLSYCISGTCGYMGAEITIAFLRKFLVKKFN